MPTLMEEIARERGFDELRVWLYSAIEEQKRILSKVGWRFEKIYKNSAGC